MLSVSLKKSKGSQTRLDSIDDTSSDTSEGNALTGKGQRFLSITVEPTEKTGETDKLTIQDDGKNESEKQGTENITGNE